MVTITYDTLDSLVIDVAEAIEKHTGMGSEILDMSMLYSTVTGYLGHYGVQYDGDLEEEEEEEEEDGH